MQQKDILETFKKYVGEFGLSQKFQIPLCKTQRIQNFGEDIKSANELTGALQTLKITFKKILDIASMLGSDEVPELVNGNHHAEDENCQENKEDSLQRYSPQINKSRTACRAARSASSTSSRRSFPP